MRIRGWKEGAGFGLKQAIKLAESCGVGGIAVSSVDADGMGCGPGLSLLSSARRLTKLPVAIAGGIRSPRDAKAALAHGADFAIIGRAIYDRKIKTREWARLQALGRMAGMAQEDG
jgi:phosphoribosylformimino-5-aminoimidazole carboxamide ribonucleotide (ProFAR) isomerase